MAWLLWLDVIFVGGDHVFTTSKPHVVQQPGWAVSVAKNAICILEAQLQAASENDRSDLYLQIQALWWYNISMNIAILTILHVYAYSCIFYIFHFISSYVSSILQLIVTSSKKSVRLDSSHPLKIKVEGLENWNMATFAKKKLLHQNWNEHRPSSSQRYQWILRPSFRCFCFFSVLFCKLAELNKVETTRTLTEAYFFGRSLRAMVSLLCSVTPENQTAGDIFIQASKEKVEWTQQRKAQGPGGTLKICSASEWSRLKFNISDFAVIFVIQLIQPGHQFIFFFQVSLQNLHPEVYWRYLEWACGRKAGWHLDWPVGMWATKSTVKNQVHGETTNMIFGKLL